MAYRIEADEDVRAAISRCAREQVDQAVESLTTEMQDDPVAAVHSARKAVKKTRALVRFSRAALPKSQRRRENATLRGAARRLSGVREAEVNLQTLATLAERFSGRVPETTFRAVRTELEQERDAAGSALASSTRVREAVRELQESRTQIDDWDLRRTGWRAVGAGLDSAYRRGRREFARAREEPTSEALHEWRKRVKDLWYQLRLLAPAAGPSVGGQADEADQLADLLGDAHDLAVLRTTLLRVQANIAEDLDPLLDLIDHRGAQLQAEALAIGVRLYGEKPKRFVARVRRCWKSGREVLGAVSELPAGEISAVG